MTARMQRGLAWAVFGLCVVILVAGTPVQFMGEGPPVSSTWGSGGGVDVVLDTVIAATLALVGMLIAREQPGNRIGWILLAISAVVSLGLGADAYARYGLVVRPGSLPGPTVVAAFNEALWVPAIGLTGTFLILLFPNGRLLSPRWRPVAWLAAITMTVVVVALTFRPGPLTESPVPNVRNPIAIERLGGLLEALLFALPLLPLCILASAVALVLRFRRSRGVERLQLKWLTTAGAFVACCYLVTMLGTILSEFSDADSTAPTWVVLLQNASVLSFVLIPAAIGVAVLKHGLYGIDVVINKALVFGALGAFITGVYVAIVVGIGTLVGQGNNSLALSIAATAVVAIAFQPVRERVQHLANRLVYGQRATPYEVLSDFANRMGGAYGSAELLPKMARTVAEGTGAARVEVWLRVGPNLVAEATWPTRGAPASDAIAMPADELPALAGDRVVPVRHQGELLGAITVTKPPGEAVTPAEDKLLADVAAQAGLVLRNVRLIEELRGSRERLVKTQDTERRRLERNLHDGAQQSLVSVALILRMTQAKVRPEQEKLAQVIDQAFTQLKTAIEELRELARGIHPAILTERGLGAAITSLAERSRIPVTINTTVNGRLDPTIEGTVYFVVAEALTNVAKYAQATAATITVHHDEDELTTTITDDGIGGADPSRGSGLAGLVDRIAAVNGHLDVHSPTGAGTQVVCRIPVSRPAESTVTPANAEMAPSPA